MKKIIFIAIAAIIFIASLAAKNFFDKKTSETEAAASKIGLIGYWTMDSVDISGTTYYDKSGLGNHVSTFSGSPTIVAGKINESAGFNAATYLARDDNNSFDVTSSFTLSAWIKTNANSGVIMAHYLGASPYTGWGFAISGEGWGATCSSKKIAFFSNNNGQQWICGAGAVTVGVWTHVAVVQNSGTATFYKNGVAVDSSASSAPDASTATFLIGTPPAGSTDRFNGNMDDVRIYNRALSSQEILNLYKFGAVSYVEAPAKTASSTPSGQLVGYWNMDTNDINGTTIYDKSEFKNNGTLTGTTASTGVIKQARTFNGTSDYIQMSSSALYFDTDDPMTLTTWIKTASSTLGVNGMVVLGKEQVSGTVTGYAFGISERNVIFFVISQEFMFSMIDVEGSTNVTDNKWHLISATYDGSKSVSGVKLYVDGILQSATVYRDSLTGNMDDVGTFEIGGATGTNYLFEGSIDDARVYNYAMSAQEVANLYSAAKVAYISAPTKTGLVGYWNMDANDKTGATMLDKSGFTNHGTVYGGATTSTGIIKQALNFDSTNDYIQIPDDSELKPTTEYTITAWVKWNSFTNITNCGGNGTTFQWILHKRNSATGNFSAYGLTANGDLKTWATVMSVPDVSTTYAGSSNGSAVLGKWTHLVGTFKRPTMKIYVDGSLAGQNTFDSDVYNHTRPVFIGRSGECGGAGEGNWDGYFNGIIDDVRIYNREFSAEEAANLYSAGKTGYMQ